MPATSGLARLRKEICKFKSRRDTGRDPVSKKERGARAEDRAYRKQKKVEVVCGVAEGRTLNVHLYTA